MKSYTKAFCLVSTGMISCSAFSNSYYFHNDPYHRQKNNYPYVRHQQQNQYNYSGHYYHHHHHHRYVHMRSPYQYQQTGNDEGAYETNNSRVIGGRIANMMDEFDKRKLFHALDVPPGKTTHWTNPHTSASYELKSIKKLTIEGNPYCREYQLSVTKDGNTKEMQGTACVGQDSIWHAA